MATETTTPAPTTAPAPAQTATVAGTSTSAAPTSTSATPAGTTLAPLKNGRELEYGSEEHTKMTKARPTRDRQKEYAKMRKVAAKNGDLYEGVPVESYIAGIEARNADGVPVHVKNKSTDFLFQKTGEKKTQQVQAQAQAEQEEGFWERNAWLKWTLIALGTIGLGVGAYFIFRKKDKKSPAGTTSTSPTPTEQTPTNPAPTTSKNPGLGNDLFLGGDNNTNTDGGNTIGSSGGSSNSSGGTTLVAKLDSNSDMIQTGDLGDGKTYTYTPGLRITR